MELNRVKLKRMLGIALLAGAEVNEAGTSASWDVSRGCETPRKVYFYSRAYTYGLEKRRPHLEVTLQTPCRRCKTCMGRRARMWFVRALLEWSSAPRTWFVTLTFDPQVWAGIELATMSKAGFEELTENQQRYRVDLAAYREVTLWHKRMRKAGHKYRYLSVLEHHKSGVPHFHLLVHEKETITKRQVQQTWDCGFSYCRLVQDDGNVEIDGQMQRAVRYTIKYMSKDWTTRQRASIMYGRVAATQNLL